MTRCRVVVAAEAAEVVVAAEVAEVVVVAEGVAAVPAASLPRCSQRWPCCGLRRWCLPSCAWMWRRW